MFPGVVRKRPTVIDRQDEEQVVQDKEGKTETREERGEKKEESHLFYRFYSVFQW